MFCYGAYFIPNLQAWLRMAGNSRSLYNEQPLNQKNAIVLISTLSRIFASGGEVASSKAVCPTNRATSGLDSYVLRRMTWSASILGKYHHLCFGEYLMTLFSPLRSRYRRCNLKKSSACAEVQSHIAKGLSSTLPSGFHTVSSQ